MPSLQSQPSAGAAAAVPYHVDMHVDTHGELIAFRGAKVHPLSGDESRSLMVAEANDTSQRASFRGWRQRFAVRGVAWRRGLDWAMANVPFYFHPFLVFFWTIFFFVFSTAARRTVLRNLAIIFPGSNRLANHFRAFRTFHNFAWTIAEGTNHKLNRTPFACEIIGGDTLEQLIASQGAILLTAHMGSYDLGAAMFTEQFQRPIRIIRAPEPDKFSAQHVDLALKQASAGAVKVDYSTDGAALSFDLLNALRHGEIVSIQGDRMVENVAASPAQLFGHQVQLPSGPFILALVAPAPIYPVFVLRAGYRKYRVVMRQPIDCARTERSREDDVATAMTKWSHLLEHLIRENWDQWFAFTSVFST